MTVDGVRGFKSLIPFIWGSPSPAKPRSVCRKFGAIVFLNSSCDDFEKRAGSPTPVVGELEVKDKFRWGLNDPTR